PQTEVSVGVGFSTARSGAQGLPSYDRTGLESGGNRQKRPPLQGLLVIGKAHQKQATGLRGMLVYSNDTEGAKSLSWAWIVLRSGVVCLVLSVLFLSQRFWYRALWRVTSNWGRISLRVGPRLVYIVLLLLVIITIAQGLL